MRIISISLAILLLALPLSATKYAGEIFAVSPGVLSTAMGGTGLTYADTYSAAWWNPALLGLKPSAGAELMRSQHFEGLLNQNQLSIVLPTENPTAIIINHLAIDDVKLTKLEYPDLPISNDNRPIVWKTVTNQDFIVYGAIARQLNPSVFYGFAPKLAYRNLASNSGYAFGADLGLLWQFTAKGKIGLNLRDFFATPIMWQGSKTEYVSPSLDLEAGYDFAPLAHIPLHLAVRSEMYSDDRSGSLEMGALSADFHAGMAIQPIPALRVLAGYDVDTVTAGIAVTHRRFGLNYAFRNSSPDGLGYSQSISATYKW
ncbi:MAG: hypothetical protein M0P99_02325 [Candidatus Cloacimonetes bacterium]|nr:hypothetical protein [Candidatus Cloacimonadota bacterium]